MQPASASSYDIFISFAADDREWVKGYFFDALNSANVRFISEEAFQLGVPRVQEFERAIVQSKRTLLILSPAYMADGATQFIDLLATHYGIESAIWPVIPLLLHEVELPPRLNILTKLDVTDADELESSIARLCAEVKRPAPTSSISPLCPYPGMVPFSEKENQQFYGREGEIQELLATLRHYPFCAVVGASGSGKSSLVFAGLIPELRKSQLFGMDDWLVLDMRPGEKPLSTLTQLLNIEKDEEFDLKKLVAAMPGTVRLLLVIDQFEEIFTVGGDQDKEFLDALQRLIATPNCYIILTVRADFYVELMGCALWSEIKPHRLEITSLSEAQLRLAIIRPAENVGVFIESALVERLVVNAAGQPGFMPFVQEILVLLWEKLERRFLPLRAYDALVISHRSYHGPERTGLQIAIAQKADAILAKLSETQQNITRRILLRLVQFGEGRTDTRRQQSELALYTTGDDPILFQETLNYLAQNRLLTLSGAEQGDRKVDISHEAMLTGWPKLQSWIAERRGTEQTRRRLEDKAAEWVRSGSGEDGLLSKALLSESEKWLKSIDAAELGVSDELRNLVQASRILSNPGWHPLGTLGLLLGIVSGAALLGWSYYFLQYQRPSGTLNSVVLMILFLLLLTVVGVFVLSRRSNPFLVQKATHIIGESNRWRWATSLIMLVCIVVWLGSMYTIRQTEEVCQAVGFVKGPSIHNIVVLNKNVDPQALMLFRVKLMSIDSRLRAVTVEAEEREIISRCRNWLTYQIILHQEVADQLGDTLYEAGILQFPSVQLRTPILLNGKVGQCEVFTRLARQFVKQYTLPTLLLLGEGDNIAKPASCAPLLINENGVKLNNARRFSEAQDIFTLLVADYPSYAEAQANLGEAYYEQGKYPEAINAIQRAIALTEQTGKPYAPFFISLGIAYFRAGDYQHAKELFQRSTDIEPSALAYYHLSSVYLAIDDYAAANKALQQMEVTMINASQEPTFLDLFMHQLRKNRGILAYKQGRLEQAASELEAATTTTYQQYMEEIVYYQALTAERLENHPAACAFWQTYRELPVRHLFNAERRRHDAEQHRSELGCS